MLINLTNHPYKDWPETQKAAAAEYGDCIDVPFPNVDPSADEDEIISLADSYFHQVVSHGNMKDMTIHVMGEQTLCFALISRFLRNGIRCIASCTERDVTVTADGTKSVRFHFVRFRDYTV